MRQARLDDLELEKWLRERERGEIVWKTKSGEEIPINKMPDTHLENAINRIIKISELNEIAAEYAAEIECDFG